MLLVRVDIKSNVPVSIDIFLFGNDNLSVEINAFIFSCVQIYIKDTRRFS